MVRQFHRLPSSTPLRRRLLVLSAAGIIPLAIMAGLGLRALQREQLEQAERTGRELSRSVANAVEFELEGALAVLETLATSPSLDERNYEEFRIRAVRVLRLRPDWLAITLAGPDGAPHVDTRVEDVGTPAPVLERESFDRVVRTRHSAIGNLTRGPHGWFFPVRVPVVHDGVLRYVVSAISTPDAIHRVLQRQRLPADWVISIIDAAGQRVARSRAHEETLGGRLSETAGRLVAGGLAEGFAITYTLEGERIYTPYTRLSNGWTAVLGLPTALADAAMTRALVIYGGGILLSIVLGALGAMWVARSITRPIGELRAAAEALGHRQPPSLPDTAIHEIRDVAAALRRASDDLAQGEAEREELLRNERLAREAAEAADRAKDEFMAVLSHELRTPLNAVYGWAKMLQDGQLRDASMEERAKQAIVRNADVQMQLIDDLLDLSRITTGKLRLDVRRVELPLVVQAAVDSVRPAADAKGIRLETSCDPGVEWIYGDAGRLQQVVWNLLMNAVKFTPRGGEVRVAVARADAHVRIQVSDTGEGISADVLPHVFERFRQGDSSTTRAHGGLGLGLALVKHLVELHGGTVRGESPGTGRGATFTVFLPAAWDTPAATTAVPSLQAPRVVGTQVMRLDGVRTLIVDDDVDGLALTEAILAKAGADVRVCSSSVAALDLLKTWSPDVLVSDIEMPGEDGYSLIRRVRALDPADGGTTPAVALTAYGRPQDRARSLAAGFNMHVPKPVDPGELTTIVAGLVGRSGAARG